MLRKIKQETSSTNLQGNCSSAQTELGLVILFVIQNKTKRQGRQTVPNQV